jgi:cation:H+ antiporter
MIFLFIMLFLSLAMMVLGAELLVRGASQLAAMFGVSHLVIGLTIVAFGTSAPELAVGIKGVLTDHTDLVVGNFIGSNIFNVLFIIGSCAAFAPLVVTKQLIRLDVPIMIGSNALLLLLSLEGTIGKVDAVFLLAIFFLYYWFVVCKSRQESASLGDSKTSYTFLAMTKQMGIALIGLFLCVAGAERLVDHAVILARIAGVSELIIGLTVVSIGTSLPELATSVVATIRGQRDIAIGNVIGSCIFNVLGGIGLVSLIAPKGVSVAPSVLTFDLPVVIASSIACLPVFFTGYKISRWEGFLFLFYYFAYTTYLILEAQQHDVLPVFSTVMLWFAIPLPALTLLVVVYRSLHKI